LPLYPQLQISTRLRIVEELGLTERTRLDLWKDGGYTTLALDSVICVEKNRVLLKIRPSLLACLKDEDCPGIEDEQTLASKKTQTRPHITITSPIRIPPLSTPSAQVRRSNSQSQQPVVVISSPESTPPPRQLRLSPSPAILSAPGPSQLPRTSLSKTQKRGRSPSTSRSSEPPRPLAKKVKLEASHHCQKDAPRLSKSTKLEDAAKVWPHGYKVYQIRDGFCKIDAAAGVRMLNGKKVKTEDAFRTAFPGVKWVKSTFYEYRNLWKKSDEEVRDLFVDLGDDENATFDRFHRALDNPYLLPAPRSSPLLGGGNSKLVTGGAGSDGSSSSSEDSDNDDVADKSNGSMSGDGQTNVSDITRPRDVRSLPSAWPSSINLDALTGRILDIQEILDEIYEEPNESDFYRGSRASFAPGMSSQSSSSSSAEYFSALERCAG